MELIKRDYIILKKNRKFLRDNNLNDIYEFYQSIIENYKKGNDCRAINDFMKLKDFYDYHYFYNYCLDNDLIKIFNNLNNLSNFYKNS